MIYRAIMAIWLLPLLTMCHQWLHVKCDLRAHACVARPPVWKLKSLPGGNTCACSRRTWQAHQLSFGWEKAKWFWVLLGLPRVISLINIHSSREWELISRNTFYEWQIHLSKMNAVRSTKCSVLCAETWLLFQTGNTVARQQFKGLPMRQIRFWFICILLAANHLDFCIVSASQLP